MMGARLLAASAFVAALQRIDQRASRAEAYNQPHAAECIAGEARDVWWLGTQPHCCGKFGGGSSTTPMSTLQGMARI